MFHVEQLVDTKNIYVNMLLDNSVRAAKHGGPRRSQAHRQHGVGMVAICSAITDLSEQGASTCPFSVSADMKGAHSAGVLQHNKSH